MIADVWSKPFHGSTIMLAAVRNGSCSLFRISIASSTTRSSTYLQARPPVLSTRCYATQVEKNTVKGALTREAAFSKTYKPITPGICHLKLPLNEHFYEGRPVRLLTIVKRKAVTRTERSLSVTVAAATGNGYALSTSCARSLECTTSFG